jgi:hypothetical protein
MEKSTGLAVIALVIALSSLAATYLEYLPQLTTLSNHIDTLEHQIDDLQEQQTTLTVNTVLFSRTFTQIDFVHVYELIPRPSDPFIARSIMITLEYQLSHYEESAWFFSLVQINPVVSNISTPQEDTLLWHQFPIEDGFDPKSWSTGILSSDTPAEELLISIGVLNATGYLNGTITQIIIR